MHKELTGRDSFIELREQSNLLFPRLRMGTDGAGPQEGLKQSDGLK